MYKRQIEDRLYQKWLDNKYFHADAERGKREGKKPFTIVMPPPNITGQLHMGHALDNTMQDILIRYKSCLLYTSGLAYSTHSRVRIASRSFGGLRNHIVYEVDTSWCENGDVIRGTINPVSYTHLDVYKRQPSSSMQRSQA